jgi:tetratricopeptide (TPR) repeat protein
MAGVHVSAKQYNTAAQYLQQALDHQKNVEYTIKDDLIGILKQLGMTYALAGDVDRAIECYSESVEAYEEMTSVFASDIALTLGTLATLYHVKACIQDDSDDMNDLCLMAERCYRDAICYDPRSSVCVQYANYLYQQTQWSDALLIMLPIVHIKTKHLTKDNLIVQYNGVEQAVLPEHITSDVDDYDEVTLETKIFAKFLAILCYKQLSLMKDAEDVLVDLYKMVDGSSTALNHSILGYALLEMGLYEEAANSFNTASSMEPNNEIPFVNAWISLCVWAFTSVENGVNNVMEYLHKRMQPPRPAKAQAVKPSVKGLPLTTSPRSPPLIRSPQSPPQQRSPGSPGQRAKFVDKKPGPVIAKPVIVKPVSRRHQSESSDEYSGQRDQDHLMVDEEYTRSAARDSGYYDHTAEDREIPWGSHESIPEEKRDHTEKMETVLTWRTSSEPLTKSSIIEQALKAAREKRERSASVEKDTRPEKEEKPDTFVDRGYNSSEYLERQGLDDKKQEETFQTWEEEEVVETPAAILQALKGNVGGSYETALDRQLEDMGSETGTFTTSDSNYAESETYTVTDDVESNDEWHTEEIVVETPAAIIQAMRIAQEVEIETEYEKYKREEKERKARLERERAERKREQERQDRESQAAWQRVEETVESSLNILEALRTKREKSRSRETLDGQDSTAAEDDNNWTITEEVVETPMAILQALSDAKKVLGESLGLDESEIERIASGGTLDSNSPSQEDRESQWQVYEEETPTTVLKTVQDSRSYSQYPESTPEDETYSSWTTSEEVVETPAIILNTLEDSKDSRVNGMSQEDPGQATDEEDYDRERVWVTEEVVSTPAAILQAMQTNNKRDSDNRYSSSRDSWMSQEVSKPVIYDSWRNNSTQQETLHREDYSNDNGRYRSEPSYYNSRSSYSYSSQPDVPEPKPEPQEETWQVWESEETVDTPPEILALLRQQQQRVQ